MINAAFALPSAASFVKKREALLKQEGKLTLEHALGKVQVPSEVSSMLIKVKPPRQADHVLSQDASYDSLTKARNVLNEMYEETEKELDIAVADCDATEQTFRTQLDENSGSRTAMAEAIAKARADMASAAGTIESCKDTAATLKGEYEEHDATCQETIRSAEEQETILAADLAVGHRILNMTQCDPAQQAAGVAFMECQKNTHSKRSYRFDDEETHALTKQIRSSAGKFALERAAKNALGRHLGRHGYNMAKQGSAMLEIRHHKVKHSKGLVRRADPNNQTLAPDDPALQGFTEATYYLSEDKSPCSLSGCRTLSSKEACLAAGEALGLQYTAVTAGEADATAPRGCSERGGAGLSFNPSVADDNVDGSAKDDKPICQCELPEETPADIQAREDDEPSKCSVGPKNCPRLWDAISTMVAEVADALLKVKKHLAATNEYCTRISAEYSSNIQSNDVKQNDAVAEQAVATGSLNTNTEGLRIKQAEFATLSSELKDKLEDCDQKYREAADTMCGVRTIRQELYQLQGSNPFMQDCEVSDWIPEECSVKCGGGSQDFTRTVVVEAVLGGACPPLQMATPCNDHPCPIDCSMGDWSEWSGCSNECGGGLTQRVRNIEIAAQHGGEVCAATQDSAQCHTQPCSRDCELGDWSDWTDCSKACDKGIRHRFKYPEVVAYGPEGHCPVEHDSERIEQNYCNVDSCPDNLVCNSKLDIIFCLDGSGSVRPRPFRQEKSFVKHALSRLNFGENTNKAALIRFSRRIDVISDLSFDGAELMDLAGGMGFPGSSTATGQAIAKAQSLLVSGGRSDADSVIFVITDGMPNDSDAVTSAAARAREVARVVFVGVGPRLDHDALVSWASYPAESNVLHADNFEELEVRLMSFIADICPDLGCRETFTGRGQDYLGCQTQTRGGKTCQSWTSSSPWAHSYTPWNYPNGNLGDFNYCRNPDGDTTIWCFTQDPSDVWDFCDPA